MPVRAMQSKAKATKVGFMQVENTLKKQIQAAII
jgi:hypothetical protein